ncbi:tRNA pseudouridine(55) synthase TruB [Pinisolibacter aquiterrae]|uniref:tRNA pseudouridine(55) synthase TruB n=1 Tax=Pinisolibacter aquiterrae TaxID=2815579 RepID=UPI001C3D714E|nr:tRNA pseudouridine(55) synthase TruB [Pinisolibacter aquiterrae]MBV5266115.1 tRNA pseudouridine(55) synthase TruB [Pinisolibacter aquiterrae]MCC8236203.1 tRNA pseudouridine(55) synthase TruB [Pinisolibacter aquiterrae]
MARRKKFDDVNGWIVLDKPREVTSTQAVARLKRLFHANKCGHAGTLDPLASGMLPIAFGEATKTVSFVMDGTKVYRFTVRWGAQTSTDDTEGEVVARSDVRPTRAAVEAILPEFIGEIMQVPPKFSAIKIDGERAYDLARDGEEVVLEARPIEILDLVLVETPDADTAVFECECGKGTYVRALARDMGLRLGTRGHVIALRRIHVGPFEEEDLVPLADLEAAAAEGGLDAVRKFLAPVEAGLAEVTEIPVSRDAAARLRRGQSVILRGRDAPADEDAVYATCGGDLVAIGEVARGELMPRRVFMLDGE